MLDAVGDILRERGLLRPSSIPLDLGVLAASTAIVATAYIVQLKRSKAGRKAWLEVTVLDETPEQFCPACQQQWIGVPQSLFTGLDRLIII